MFKKCLSKGLNKNTFLKFNKFGLYNNTGDFGQVLIASKNNHLRVISTPEFPVPYYQRIMRNPASVEAVTINLTSLLEAPNEGHVLRVRQNLAQSPEGLKMLDYVENHLKLKSYVTSVNSVAEQCNIYADDLIHFLDCAHEENVRILKNCDLVDCLR
jgi:hypothetical protein